MELLYSYMYVYIWDLTQEHGVGVGSHINYVEAILAEVSEIRDKYSKLSEINAYSLQISIVTKVIIK